MSYTRTATSISFKTKLDEVRVEIFGQDIKTFADARDREAIYLLSHDNFDTVAESLDLPTQDNFLDLVEDALNKGLADQVFSAIQQSSKKDFFWLSTNWD